MNTPSPPAPGKAIPRRPGGSGDGAAEGAAAEGAAAASGAAEGVAADEAGGGGPAWFPPHAVAAPSTASAALTTAPLFIRASSLDGLDPGAALDAEQVARIELVIAMDAARHGVRLVRPRALEIERDLVAAGEHLRELSRHDVV